MKRFNKLLICLLLVFAVLFTLASCDDKPQPVQLTDLTLPELDGNQMAVIIKNGDNDYTSYVVTLGKGGVEATTCEQVLEYLKTKSKLVLTWEDGAFGKFIKAIGGITVDPTNQYVEIFTSNTQFQGDWAGVETRVAGDTTLVSASKGVTELGVAAGDVVYFERASF